MAFPFGGLPRLSEYLHWANTTHGCTSQSGFTKVDDRMETFVRIDCAANGTHVFVYADFKEYLTPSMVSYIDRRLDVASPYPKLVTYEDAPADEGDIANDAEPDQAP